MSVIRIPNAGLWQQPNKGEIFGNLKSTLNVDFRTNPGKMRLNQRMSVLTKDNDTSISSFGLPIAFANFIHTDGSIRTIAATGIATWSGNSTGKLFMSADSDYGVFANLAGNYATNQPTDVNLSTGDMIVWNGSLYVVRDPNVGTMNIARLSSDTWTNSWYVGTLSGSPTSDALMNMWVGFNGNLYLINGDTVEAVTTGGTLITSGTAGAIDFGGVVGWTGLRPIWGRSSSNKNWIGLMSWFAATGGTSKGESYVAEWDGTGTAANRIFKIDSPCVLTCCIYKDTPYILDGYGILKKFDGTGFKEVARLPVANTNIEMPGIYYAIRNDRWVHHRGMEVVNGKINILVNNYVSSGVYVDDMPSGVWEFDPENPSQGLYHKGAPCATALDYGQQFVDATGAIFPLRDTLGNYMAGISYYTDNVTTNRKAIFYDELDSNINKRGSFVTPFIKAVDAQEEWNTASYRFRQLPVDDKIIGKWRTGKKTYLPFIASITWTSATTFTSTNTDFQYASVGDEVEGMMGQGASTTCHITAISYSNPTYTITVDESQSFSSGTAKAKIDNFQKMGVISAQNINQDELSPMATNANIQIKTEMRFSGDIDLDDLTIISTAH